MTTLYEIAAQYRNDAERLSDLTLDEQTIKDTLESLSGGIESKAKAVVMFSLNLESTAAAIKAAEEKMALRRHAIENRAQSLKRYVLASMQLAGISKIECPYFRMTIQNNPPAVEVIEPSLVPDEFMTHHAAPPPSVNKKALAEAMKFGQEFNCARLIQTQRLVIK